MPESNPTAPQPLAEQNDTPEDVATLYSWANLHGAKYRDFSASRAQAREEARLRAEEAAAAERRRQEEEAERIRQEEAQLAARLAAEAAEAARQAEADRLAEIARQAEIERQAVLAAQEAQRQALQQRGWQEPSTEPAPQLGVERLMEPHQLLRAEPEPYHASEAATHQRPDFGQPGYAHPHPEPVTALVQPFTSSPGGYPDETFARRPQPQENGVAPAPFRANQQRPSQSNAGQSNPAQSNPAQSNAARPHPGYPYPDYGQSPFAPTAAYPMPPEESYLPSPWQPADPREEREHREQAFRPAWLAPELAPPTQAPVTQAPATQASVPFSHPAPPPFQPRPAANLTPNQAPNRAPKQVPMYAQTVAPGPYAAQNPESGPNQNPGQAPNPVEDTLTGSRDRIANRWYALKSVFDPQSAPVEPAPAQPPARVPALAVFSLAGGVGKTSLVASLGRALSSRGERVLLVDTAAYGLLPFFFGARDQRPGQLRTFNPPGVSAEAPIQLVTLDPDSQFADAQNPDPNQGQQFAAERSQDWLAQEVTRFSRGANRIIIDLPTASGATTRRVLRLAPVVLVPVVPDMNSVVSVGAIESFFRNNGNLGGKQILPYYLLNQFDYSLPLHLDVREILREQIGDRLLPFALRRSPAISEALAEGMTVMDYAPGAVVAEDYATLAGWVRSLSAPAAQSYRGVRWSER